MPVRALATLLLLLVAGLSPVSAHTPPAGSPLANREHPRIWITGASMPALRAKLSGPLKAEYQAFVTYLENADPGDKIAAENVINYAFIAAVGAVPGITYAWPFPTGYSDHAKSVLMNIIATIEPSKNDANIWPAVAYDWLYHVLTPDERLTIWNYQVALNDVQNGVKDPWDDRSGRTVQRRVLAGLAFWGDGIDDAMAGSLADYWYSSVRGGMMLDAANFIAADDGGVSEGFAYAARGGESSSIENLLKILEGWRTANGLTREETFAPATALRYFPQWVAYSIRPHAHPNPERLEGLEHMTYKTHNMDPSNPIDARGTLRAIIAALRLYQDIDPGVASLCQWLLDHKIRIPKATGEDTKDKALLGLFLLGEKGVVAKSPEELGLPLSKKFDGIGWVAMRTGFQSLSDSYVTFIASPWRRTSYTNSNQNSFTIDRFGPLSHNTGANTHHGYANKTWASNTIIFPDPGENWTNPDGWDMGGQRPGFSPTVTNVNMLVPGSKYDLVGVTRFQPASPSMGVDFDYVFGDATRAYNGPTNNDAKNSIKVKSFTRQLVYFRPASPAESDRVVVFDRAETTDPKFEKRWLLHMAYEPQVNATGALEREGKWSYSGANLVTVTNDVNTSHGRLFSRTLLPEQVRISKIGGPDHEFEDPYGQNDPASELDPADPIDAQYMMMWRVEVTPTVPAASDVFLHVLEATEAGVASPTPTVLLNGVGFVAARVGQRIAAFSRIEALLSTGEITVDAAGTYRVVFCDLVPGAEYEVRAGTDVRRVIASSAGVLSADLTVGANTRVVLTATGVQIQPPAAPASAPRILP